MADESTEYTRGERVAGIFGALLFAGLLLIAIDLATGGKVFRRGCGCPEGASGDDES